MGAALLLHLVCIGVWLGCILVEGIVEHAIDDSASMRRFMSELHWRIDRYVEIPTFVAVLLTGAYLAGSVALTPWLIAKIGFGLLAVLLNAYCVLLAFRRLEASRAHDFAAWEAIDERLHRFGALVLIALVLALAIGGMLFVVG
jgi:hypothetical protein